jgi:hypothetical protein
MFGYLRSFNGIALIETIGKEIRFLPTPIPDNNTYLIYSLDGSLFCRIKVCDIIRPWKQKTA